MSDEHRDLEEEARLCNLHLQFALFVLAADVEIQRDRVRFIGFWPDTEELHLEFFDWFDLDIDFYHYHLLSQAQREALQVVFHHVIAIRQAPCYLGDAIELDNADWARLRVVARLAVSEFGLPWADDIWDRMLARWPDCWGVNHWWASKGNMFNGRY